MTETDNGTTPEHSALIKSIGSKKKADYELTVTGSLAPGETFDNDGTDYIDEQTAGGRVAGGGEDGFRYDGDVVGFKTNGPAKLIVDGIEVSSPEEGKSAHTPSPGDDTLTAGPTGGDRNWVDLAVEKPKLGRVSRPLHTTQPVEYHVSPNGDDDAQGTADDPFRSVQQAMNHVPYFVTHDVTVNVADGTYDTDIDGYALHCTIMLLGGSSDFRLQGNSDHPENVVHSGRMNWTGFGKGENMTVAGMTFTRHSQFAGVGDVRSCRFKSPDQQRSLSGKSGRVFFKNCEIGDPSNEYAVRANQMVQYHFDNCTFYGQRAAIEGRNANLFVVEGNCDNQVKSGELFDPNDGTRAMLGGAVIA